MAKLSDYDCIGFDLDHTLIQYKLDNLYPFIYNIFTQALVKEKGYDPCLLDDNFEDLKDFCLRGLVLDIKKGNILKLGKDGYILRATHGTRQMTREEVRECYGENSIWPEINSLKENPVQQSTIFRVFENYFDLPVVIICARIVDIIDKKNGRLDEYNFWPDVIAMLRKVFSPSAFADQEGSYFFPGMVKNTAKFVKQCSKKIIEWMKALKDGKQKVFLLTNSYIDYTNLLMKYAVGEHWPEMFDIIICMSGKPGFFKSEEPLTQFYEVDGEKEVGMVKELKENKIYSRGNHKDFTTFLQKQTNKDNPKVLYFGDSMKSDLYPATAFGDWDVVTVLEEMESEGMVVQHTKAHENQDSDEDGPRSKKPRYLMNDHIEIEKNKEEVLLSNQWGSFFSHDDSTETGRTEDCNQYINNIMDGFFVCQETKERREMNTFWGDLIQRHSTIAIPRIDFITELPLDHSFEPFSSSSGGFYPGSPKSLHL